jgi:hypothetical protein
MTKKSIYDLALHEQIQIGEDVFCAKVPGGWIYQMQPPNGVLSTVFVPYNREFAPEQECKHENINIAPDCITHTCNDCGATRRNDALHKGEWINNKPSDALAPEQGCKHHSISFTNDSEYHTCNDCGATRLNEKIQDTAWIKKTEGRGGV